jgi:cystathionine beta-lyase/cystathionine gamma-synthase
MSAIDIAVSIFQSAGDKRALLFFSEIYGGTLSFAEEVLRKRRGLDVRDFHPKNEKYDLEEFEATMRKLKPSIVYVETVSNPMLIVPDAKGIIRIAKEHGAMIIVDNTFATPLLWKPLNDGADIVIYSATKYFSGHGNLTAGIVCGNDKGLFKDALEYRRFVGHMLSPDDAYRLQTQMKTIRLRFRQQNSNAALIASILCQSGKVNKVWYPGLVSHPTHAEARSLFGGKEYGGMITFDFAGKSNEEKRRRRDDFISYVSDFIKLVPSLGDPSTILLPVESVWGVKYPEPGMIRMSAGFEDPDELSKTIRNALQSIS